MTKMPFVRGPRYLYTKDQYKTQQQQQQQQQIKEDVSSIQREPYPQEHEINLLRHRRSL